jgi:hypothetical protein
MIWFEPIKDREWKSIKPLDSDILPMNWKAFRGASDRLKALLYFINKIVCSDGAFFKII